MEAREEVFIHGSHSRRSPKRFAGGRARFRTRKCHVFSA
ncbi:hypothetical protein FM101_10790 [Arthrobacter rhombi]|uniref:Uncharacterized protein n=1 Tax=Arthrobacter rhombi TaxID=71253 RepID=A0A1R4GIZ2_9MICC|nr:hypothetical protein FM101_10790 [Arthrobacter rhombi]